LLRVDYELIRGGTRHAAQNAGDNSAQRERGDGSRREPPSPRCGFGGRVNRSARFPASHYARHGLRIRQALLLSLPEPDRHNTDAGCAAWAARSNHADSEV